MRLPAAPYEEATALVAEIPTDQRFADREKDRSGQSTETNVAPSQETGQATLCRSRRKELSQRRSKRSC